LCRHGKITERVDAAEAGGLKPDPMQKSELSNAVQQLVHILVQHTDYKISVIDRAGFRYNTNGHKKSLITVVA